MAMNARNHRAAALVTMAVHPPVVAGADMHAHRSYADVNVLGHDG
jgi:hypothetical protein